MTLMTLIMMTLSTFARQKTEMTALTSHCSVSKPWSAVAQGPLHQVLRRFWIAKAAKPQHFRRFQLGSKFTKFRVKLFRGFGFQSSSILLDCLPWKTLKNHVERHVFFLILLHFSAAPWPPGLIPILSVAGTWRCIGVAVPRRGRVNFSQRLNSFKMFQVIDKAVEKSAVFPFLFEPMNVICATQKPKSKHIWSKLICLDLIGIVQSILISCLSSAPQIRLEQPLVCEDVAAKPFALTRRHWSAIPPESFRANTTSLQFLGPSPTDISQ